MKNVNTASQITVYECYIFHDWAAGRIKFDRGPDLARGPDFGHAWCGPSSLDNAPSQSSYSYRKDYIMPRGPM